jgi:hypothetical protein
MKSLRAPRSGRIIVCIAIGLAIALTSGATAAHSGGTPSATIKPMCVGQRPASRRGPFAHCDAWAKTSSTGKASVTRAPSKAMRAAAKAKASLTASPNAVQEIWPDELSSAYSLPPTTTGSASQTVGIVDAWGDQHIVSDLAQMNNDFEFGAFPTCNGTTVTASCFQVVNQTGGTSLPSCTGSTNDCIGWAVETALDVEAVHIVCRDCKIILVEGNSDNFNDLATAENEAVDLGANVVSNSYGASEGGTDGVQQSDFDTFAPDYIHDGVLIVASSGDDAFAGGTSFPADVNSVVSVGGTTLSTSGVTKDDTAVGYQSETAWFTPASGGFSAEGAGSGCSIFQSPQPWQASANGWNATGCGTERAVADVSADANPASGLRVYDTDPLLTSGTDPFCTPPACYFLIGGTSLAGPIIAATYALAANPNTVANPQSLPYAHFRSLHDVTAGSTGTCSNATICRAAPGYDGPTGIGSPNGLLGFEIGTPSISSFTPTAGPAGTTVTIKGQSFTQASAVTVGGTPVQSFHVDSDIQITAVVGAGTTGAVRVTTPGGIATSGNQFQFAPTITSFTPKGGATGTSVTITGAGFGGASAVKFGGTDAASFTVDSDTQITATTAAGTKTGPIAVTGGGGTGTSSAVFYGPPSISSITPTSGGEHSTVTVTGTNLSGASSVKLNGHSAAFAVVSATTITLTVPTGATTGTISVTTPGGAATSGTFTVDPPPAITSFTPGTGSVGTPVTITGTNLQDVVGIQIGTIITVPTSVSAGQVIFSIPPGAVSGLIRLLARNGTVTSATPLTVG